MPFPGIGIEEVGKTLFIGLRPKVLLRCGEVFQRCFHVNSGFQTSLPAEKRDGERPKDQINEREDGGRRMGRRSEEGRRGTGREGVERKEDNTGQS